MKNFESPTRSSVPGLTASHDSEWFEFSCCGPHVPGSGFVDPGGTGYPPPATGELATTFVPTRLQVGSAPLVIAKTPAATPAVARPASIRSSLFTALPPFRPPYSSLDLRPGGYSSAEGGAGAGSALVALQRSRRDARPRRARRSRRSRPS